MSQKPTRRSQGAVRGGAAAKAERGRSASQSPPPPPTTSDAPPADQTVILNPKTKATSGSSQQKPAAQKAAPQKTMVLQKDDIQRPQPQAGSTKAAAKADAPEKTIMLDKGDLPKAPQAKAAKAAAPDQTVLLDKDDLPKPQKATAQKAPTQKSSSPPPAQAAKASKKRGPEKTTRDPVPSATTAKQPSPKKGDEHTIILDPSKAGELAPSSVAKTEDGRPEEETAESNFFSQPSGTGSPVSGDLKPGQMPHPGQRMNQYEIIRLIGEGGMGAVFLARDTKLGRRVAIKFLQSTDPELTQRFIIEARATARVEHENIVSIYEVGEWNQIPYMVLQYLQGQELSQLIPRDKRMPVSRVVELMSPVLRALSVAHKEGIIHRDLKPDNIFVTESGVTKVLDFGIAKVAHDGDTPKRLKAGDFEALDGNENVTRHGAIMGTMPYMSPEQWGNGVAIDHTTDIWAVGIMMYQMLAGKHPLHPLSGHELMVTGFLDEATPSLRDKAPDLPRELIKVIDRCLVKEKAKRWPDATALLRALEPFQPGYFAPKRRTDIEESPYNGLESFQEEDAARFFGRDRETVSMTQRLRERPLMAIVGPSGVGKSSFVRAGVVPALRNSGESWDISVIRPGATPLQSLANLLIQSAGTSLDHREIGKDQKKLIERLEDEPGYLGAVLRRQARKLRKNILIFVDQFEELYTLVGQESERLAFTASLTAAADDPTTPLRVVISMRSDFLDRVTEDPVFMDEISKGLFFLTAPTRSGMRDAIIQPAEMAGYKFESEAIVDEMLDHLAQTSGALPLLQFTADRLWQERDVSKRLLTDRSYRALGGISGALAAHADRVLQQMPAAQKEIAGALMVRLVTSDRTRAIVPVEDLKETLGKSGRDVQEVIDKLVLARLLTVQTGGGGQGSTVEIVHESLINGWPQLSRWLDEGSEDAAFLEQLRNAARQWDDKDRDRDLLWRGEMVEEAKRFIRRFKGEIPDLQAFFLKAVIDHANRAQRRKRTLTVMGTAFLLILLAAAIVALVVISSSRDKIAQQTEIAEANAAAAEISAQEAEERRQIAEKALEEARAASVERDRADEARREALDEAVDAKQKAEEALEEAEANLNKAIEAETRARNAKLEAERQARQALWARNSANRAAKQLQEALEIVEQQRLEAEEAKREAEERLKLVTKGGVVTELK